MTNFSLTWIELFLALLVGMGPFKAMLMFVELTENYNQRTRDKVAILSVLTAAGCGISLLFLGAGLQSLLHFSLGALSITGGLILLLFSLRIVLGDSNSSSDDHDTEDPMSVAISPLAIPLLLNPVGIVALVTFSAETEALGGFVQIIIVIAALVVINVVTLLLAGRIGSMLPHSFIQLLEKVFSILVSALAVQLIVDGSKSMGII
jgi:multiple antibiotic resistance protein